MQRRNGERLSLTLLPRKFFARGEIQRGVDDVHRAALEWTDRTGEHVIELEAIGAQTRGYRIAGECSVKGAGQKKRVEVARQPRRKRCAYGILRVPVFELVPRL